ncbi:MAG: hypothetical protein C4343_04555, partial [Chloroflexota bacterium]
ASAACLAYLGHRVVVVEADAPIVAQELRLRAGELLAAFRTRPGGRGATELVIRVRPVGRL